jgi:pectate lyase-like protein
MNKLFFVLMERGIKGVSLRNPWILFFIILVVFVLIIVLLFSKPFEFVKVKKFQYDEAGDVFDNVYSNGGCYKCPSGCSCGEDEYCSNGVCLLEVSGNTYFVSLEGNDSNPGTFEEPFYSWQRGAEAAYPGDIVYIRGGVWYPTKYIGHSSTIGMTIGPDAYAPNTRSGTKDAPIRYFNYPGERPILDGSLMKPSKTQWLSGIGIGSVEYIHMKGLTVRHIHQSPPDFSHVKPHTEVFGIGSGGANHYFENMVVHDIDGRAYQHWSDAWSMEDAEYAVEGGWQEEIQIPKYEKDVTMWVNCDAYNLFDRYDDTPGNAADGWKVETYSGSEFYWIGCRAWNYSDDGFDPHGSGLRVFINSWAMATDRYEGLSEDWDVETNGFKTTGSTGIPLKEGEHGVIFKNCIAAFNPGTGFITNLGSDIKYSSRPLYLNNFAYKNGWAYWHLDGGVVKNNIAYGTTNIGPIGEIYNIVGDAYSEDSFYTESNNTWRLSTDLGWPPSYINPDYDVNDDDFVSLDYWELTAPRKEDGSLPDISFGHLKEGSDLIDSGVDVGLPYNGANPDLGAFEY